METKKRGKYQRGVPRDDFGVDLPSPEEIERRAAAIRASWSHNTERQRRGMLLADRRAEDGLSSLEIPEVFSSDLVMPDEGPNYR